MDIDPKLDTDDVRPSLARALDQTVRVRAAGEVVRRLGADNRDHLWAVLYEKELPLDVRLAVIESLADGLH